MTVMIVNYVENDKMVNKEIEPKKLKSLIKGMHPNGNNYQKCVIWEYGQNLTVHIDQEAKRYLVQYVKSNGDYYQHTLVNKDAPDYGLDLDNCNSVEFEDWNGEWFTQCEYETTDLETALQVALYFFEHNALMPGTVWEKSRY